MVTDPVPYLCEGCPGKGNAKVDFDVRGFCPRYTSDSFKQARRFWLDGETDGNYDIEEFDSIEELAGIIDDGFTHYDADVDRESFMPGNYQTATLGGLCAQQFLDGNCQKTHDQIIQESQTY